MICSQKPFPLSFIGIEEDFLQELQRVVAGMMVLVLWHMLPSPKKLPLIFAQYLANLRDDLLVVRLLRIIIAHDVEDSIQR